jgi:ATP-grasp domain
MSGRAGTILVVYDHGAVSPAEIRLGLADLADVVFLVPATAHLQHVGEVLETLGNVYQLSGDPGQDEALARRFRADGIVTFSEAMLRTTTRLAAAARLPFHEPHTIELLTNKYWQRSALRDAGVDDVRCHLLRCAADWPDALAAVGLPAVIKPARGGGSRRTYLASDAVRTHQLLTEVFQSWDGPDATLVAEQFLRGQPSLPFSDQLSVESACTPRGVFHLSITGRLPLASPFRETGGFVPIHLGADRQAEILSLVSDALVALGVTYGLTHTEVKLTPDGPHIIEVNGRLGGHVNFMTQEATGVSLVRIAGQLALGQEVEPPFLKPDLVHFQYHVPAPTQSFRLDAVHGGRDVRRMDGVTGYRLTTRLGEHHPADVGTRELDEFWGVCPDHDTMVDLVDRACSALSYDITFGDGQRRVNARDLLS